MRTALYLLFLLALAAVPGLAKTWQSDPDTCGRKITGANLMIKGGKEAKEHAWPWQVAMYLDGGFICGGSLIDPWWVMTAAHCSQKCFASGTPTSCLFMMGSNNRMSTIDFNTNDTQWNVAVTNYIHPNYTLLHGYDNDIALLKMIKPFYKTNNRTVNTVCLPTRDMADQFKVGEEATVTGWGMLKNGTLPDKLYQAVLPIYDREKCNKSWNGSITVNMMCTFEEGVDACNGDSGGPLVAFSEANTEQYYLIGLVSWGTNCSVTDIMPGVYTNITQYEDWIRSIIYDSGQKRSEKDTQIITGLSASLAVVGAIAISLGLLFWRKSRSSYSVDSLEDHLVQNGGYGSTRPI